jgi:hypothetical protein
VIGFIRRRKLSNLDAKLANTDARLALLKIELAAQMVKLAKQTEDLAPLIQAEEALSAARNYYSADTIPVELNMVQVALGDTLLKLGREQSDKDSIARAKTAFRDAITLASLHGDDALREDLRAKIKLADSLLGHRPRTPPLFRAA